MNQYKIVFKRGKLSPSVKKWLGKRNYDRTDCLYDFDSVCMECHGGQGGSCNHDDIPGLVKNLLQMWLKESYRGTYHYVENDEYYEQMCKPVNKRPKRWKPQITRHRPVTRSSVFFRTDFPGVFNRDDFFKLVAELKGAKRDTLGGLWK